MLDTVFKPKLMKILKSILALASVFCLSACDSSDDDFYNMVYITKPNLIEIERQPNYQLNENLTFHVDIPNLIEEEGQNNPLNIYEMTKSDVLLVGYHIEKWENNQWIVFQEFDPEFTGAITYNGSSYQLTKQIPLTQTGSYRLIFGQGFKANTIGIMSKLSLERQHTGITISTTAINYGDGYVFYVE